MQTMTTTSMAQARSSSRDAVAGFTLIELVITIAVVAILATIAFASYQDQVVKSRRAAAAACLQERAQYMERYYSTHLSYNVTGNAATIAQCDTDVSPHYQVSTVASALTAKTYRLQAVPRGAQESRDTLCGTLTINEQGVRGESGTASSADQCW